MASLLPCCSDEGCPRCVIARRLHCSAAPERGRPFSLPLHSWRTPSVPLTYSISAPRRSRPPKLPRGLYLKRWSPPKMDLPPGPRLLSGRTGRKRSSWAGEFPVARVDAVTRGCRRGKGLPGVTLCPREGAQARSERGRQGRCGGPTCPPGEGEEL